MVVIALWLAGTLCLVAAAVLTHPIAGLAVAGAAMWLWGYLLTDGGE